MTSLRTNRCMTVLLVALIGPAVWAAEPNETPIRITFESGPKSIGPYSTARLDTAWRPFVIRKPRFAAAIPLVGSTDFLPFPGRGTMHGFLGWDKSEGYAEQHAGLSDKQKAFLYATRQLFHDARSPVVIDRPDPNGPQRLLLYTMTEEDARKMVRAYYEYALARFQEAVNGTQHAVREAPAQIAQEQQRLSSVEESIASTQKALDEIEKAAPYRTEEEARQAVAELDRLLNAAQVEIAGMTAKIEAIQAYRQQRAKETGQPISEAVAAKLDTMLVEEFVALRGAEGRRQMASRLRGQANRLLDLKSTLARGVAEKQAVAASLDKRQKRLEADKNYLASAKENKPVIPDKIVIYQVAWPRESTEN